MWREDGENCATHLGGIKRPLLCADNWDYLPLVRLQQLLITICMDNKIMRKNIYNDQSSTFMLYVMYTPFVTAAIGEITK